MNFKKLICLCIPAIICFVFMSCSTPSSSRLPSSTFPPSSFEEVYEKGNLDEKISFAMQNDLFAQQGFTVETTKYYKTTTKTFEDVDIYYDEYYFNNSFSGGIRCKIDDNILSVEFYSEYIRIRLTGEKFRYLVNTSYDFEPISNFAPQDDHLYLVKILGIVDLKEIKDLRDLYTEITEAVMADIYKTVSTERVQNK